MMDPEDDPVLLRRSDGVAMITLNRPDKRNAMTRDLIVRLRDHLDTAAADSNVRVVCLTGAGAGFCAGQDLSERDPRNAGAPYDLEAIQTDFYHPIITSIATMPKPVVASVNGVAAGAGSGLALACDIVIASASARFIQSFSKVGLSVDAGGGFALVRSLGMARAKAALMLGEPISAQDAAALGMIWKSVPDAELATQTAQLVAKLVQTPRTALACIKQAIAAAVTAPDLESYLKQEAALQGIAGAQPDYGEGVLSFLEKRTPKFE